MELESSVDVGKPQEAHSILKEASYAERYCHKYTANCACKNKQYLLGFVL